MKLNVISKNVSYFHKQVCAFEGKTYTSIANPPNPATIWRIALQSPDLFKELTYIFGNRIQFQSFFCLVNLSGVLFSRKKPVLF